MPLIPPTLVLVVTLLAVMIAVGLLLTVVRDICRDWRK